MTEGMQQVSMTTADAARVLGVKHRTVQAWVRDGKLPSIRIGTKPLVLREGIDRLIAEARGEQASRG